MSVAILLKMEDVKALHLGATGLETLRGLAGPQARPLGHGRSADYAFLAVEDTRDFAGVRGLMRQFVYLPEQQAVVEYDLVLQPDPPVAVTWKLEGAGNVQSLLPEPKPRNEIKFLHLVQTGGRQTPGKIESDELVGLRLADWALLFYTEMQMAKSAVSFDVAGSGTLKFLITGLAPGVWEIWRAGMREQDDMGVPAESGVLRFDGKPGSYFLRAI
jgi:hypothetical protein